jgi:hypothetical protein
LPQERNLAVFPKIEHNVVCVWRQVAVANEEPDEPQKRGGRKPNAVELKHLDRVALPSSGCCVTMCSPEHLMCWLKPEIRRRSTFARCHRAREHPVIRCYDEIDAGSFESQHVPAKLLPNQAHRGLILEKAID